MSLPQHITKDVGGTISIDLLARPSAVTVDVYTGSGEHLVTSGTGVLSTITTTLSSAASRGAMSVAVASGTGIANGSTFWIRDDPEDVVVQKLSSLTVYLRRPLLKDHVSGVAVGGTRVTYAISAAVADTLFFDGRVKWTVDSVPYWSALECTLYPIRRIAGPQKLFDRQPKLFEVLDPEVDTERLLDLGFEECLSRIGAKGRARVFTAGPEFENATVLAALMVHYEHSPADEATVMFTRYQALLADELERLVEIAPRDADQDGVVSAGEQISMRTVRLVR